MWSKAEGDWAEGRPYQNCARGRFDFRQKGGRLPDRSCLQTGAKHACAPVRMWVWARLHWGRPQRTGSKWHSFLISHGDQSAACEKFCATNSVGMPAVASTSTPAATSAATPVPNMPSTVLVPNSCPNQRCSSGQRGGRQVHITWKDGAQGPHTSQTSFTSFNNSPCAADSLVLSLRATTLVAALYHPLPLAGVPRPTPCSPPKVCFPAPPCLAARDTLPPQAASYEAQLRTHSWGHLHHNRRGREPPLLVRDAGGQYSLPPPRLD